MNTGNGARGIRTVGVPKEVKTLEGRVSLTPDGVREFERLGIDVFVERGAGEAASIPDADYVAAGATIVPTAASERVKRLFRERYVLGFRAMLDPKKLGRGLL